MGTTVLVLGSKQQADLLINFEFKIKSQIRGSLSRLIPDFYKGEVIIGELTFPREDAKLVILMFTNLIGQGALAQCDKELSNAWAALRIREPKIGESCKAGFIIKSAKLLEHWGTQFSFTPLFDIV